MIFRVYSWIFFVPSIHYFTLRSRNNFLLYIKIYINLHVINIYYNIEYWILS